MAGLFDDVLSNDAGIAGGLPAPKKRISAGSGLFDDVLSQPDPSSLARRVVGDSAISLLKGAISVPEAAVGIADIPTMGYAGKAAEAIGFRPKEAKAALDELYTPEQQAANARVQEAKGFVPTIAAAVQNPSVIGHTVLESLPSMGGGAVVGRGLMAAAPKIGAVGAGAIGEGSVGAGLAAEGIRQQTADGTLTPGQAGAALASGVGTAALGAAGGKVAQKLGIGDIDTMLVGGTAQAGTRSLPARVAGGAISEGLLEEMPQSMQEQAWQNVALDKPVMEGVPEAGALGALAGGVMGAGGGIISGPAKKPAGALSKTVAAGEQSGAVQPIAGALPNYPLETQIVFPDGSTGTRKQFDDYLAGLPEDQRADAMAKMLNLGAQPSRTPEDIAQAKAMAADANQSAKVRSAQLAQEEGGIGDLTKPAPTAAKKPALTAEQREANRLAMEQEKAQGELPQRSKVRTEAIPKAEAAPAQSAQQPTKESQDGQGQKTAEVLNPVGGAVKEAAPPPVSAGTAVKPADKPDAGGQGNTPKATDRAGPGLGRVLTALEQQYETAKAAGDNAKMRDLAHQINQAKAPAAPPKAEKPAAKAKGLTIGAAPGSAEPVTVRKGVIHIGDYPAQNFDSGEDVRVPEGANGRQIREALKAAGAIPRGHKIYGLQADDQAAWQPEQNPPAAKQDAGKAEQNPAKAEPIAPAEPETSAPVSNANPPSAESAGAQNSAETEDQNPIKKEPQAAPEPGATAGGSRPAPAASVDEKAENTPAAAPEAAQDKAASVVDEKAHEAASSPQNDKPEPTDAQKKAGNYEKGHVRVAGLDISIENPEGSTRSGVDPNGNPWSNTLRSHYGYFKRTEGKDGDQVDVFIRPGTPENYDGPVFVIDQKKPGNGHFDEHKVLIGWKTEKAAVLGYRQNYAKGWDGIRAITETTLADFKTWLSDGDTTKPFAERASVAEEKPEAAPVTGGNNATSDASLSRSKDRSEVRFETPYVGADGQYSLVGYVWPNKMEEYIDKRGEERVRAVSDWESAVDNIETGRQIVHQFALRKNDGSEQDVSAETAARLLGVSESTVRGNAKKLLEKEIARAKKHAQELADADKVDALNAQTSPSAAVENRVMTYSPGSSMVERMAKNGQGWRAIENRIERESASHEKYRFLTKGGRFVWSPDLSREGDEIFKRGWRNVELTAREIWPAQRMPYSDTTGEPAAEAAIKRSVVDVQNGDKPRDQLRDELVASGLPEGTIRALTQRLGDNQFSNGEISAMLEERAKQPKTKAGAEAKATPTIAERNAAQPKSLLHFLKSKGGLNVSEASDLGGDKANILNRRLPGLFRKDGMSADAAREAMQQHGWLVGVAEEDQLEQTRKLIMAALRGGENVQRDSDAVAMLEAEAEARAAEFFAENPDVDVSEDADALFGEIAGLESDGLDALLDAAWSGESKGMSDEEVERWLGKEEEGGRASEETAAATSDGRGDEGRRAADQGQGEEDFGLSGQTPAEVRAQEAQRKAEEEAAAKAQKEPTGPTVRADQVDLFNTQGGIFDAPAAQTPAEVVSQADAIAPAEPATPIESRSADEAIGDMGRRVIVRKHTATATGPRVKIEREPDQRPAWARKYRAMQIMAGRFARPESVGKWQVMVESGDRGAVSPASRQMFATEQEALDAIPLVAVGRNHNAYAYTEKPATAEQNDAASKAADDWLKEVVSTVAKLREDNAVLLVNAAVTKRFDKELAAGRITREQYDVALAKGTILSADNMAKAAEVERQIDAARNGDMKKPDGQPKTLWGVFRNITDRKRALVKGGFESREAAMAYLAQNPVEIIEHKFPFPERPWLDRIERTGKDYRNGKDVTKRMFEETFAPGAVVYGNWLMSSDGKTVNADGQALSNYVFDALMDLAETVGVPPKALFLNGELALGVGADGKGGKNSAAAHYDPAKGLINLTKIKGAGSAAHEWWHAVDHYFARNGGYKDSSSVVAGGYSTGSKARPELMQAIKAVVDAVMYSERSTTTDADLIRERAQKRIDEAVKDLDYRLKDLRNPYQPKKPFTPAQIKRWDELAAKLRDGDLGADTYVPNPSKMRGAMGFSTGANLIELNDIYKAVTGRSFLRQDSDSVGRRMHWTIQSIADNRAKLDTKEDVTTTSKGRSEFFIEAKRIDGFRASDYWSMPEELGARAFESFVFDKITAGEQRSDYLVYAVENRYYAAMDMKPYPEGSERARINQAFDALFRTIESKATDKGVEMFSRPATAQLPRGHTPATVRAEISETIGAGRLDALERKGLVRIHTDYRTMPAAAQKHPDAWGWFDGMTVHLVAGNLHTGQAAGVFQHEVWHRMLRGLRMSDSAAYVKIMDRLAKIEQNGAASKWFTEAAQMIPQEDRADYARRLNELAAYAIQQYESEPKTLPVLIRRFVEDLVASVRAFFMDTLGWVPQNLTAADLVALTRRHVRAMADGYPAIGVMGAGEAMASSPMPSGGVESAAFKRWFGRSLVVDEDGKPLPVFHGSAENITVFDASKSNTGAFFFTANPNYAASHAAQIKGLDAGYLNPSFLSLQNPKIISPSESDFSVPGYEREQVARAKEEGYDGLIIKGAKNTFYAAFDPTQVKGYNNRGTFDPANPDIRFSRQDDGIDFDPKPSTIEAAPAPIGSEDEFQSAARLFLSNFPEGTRHSERSATARAARAASEAARWEFGSDAGRTRRVASRLGPFAGYETREHVLNGLNGHKMLVVNVYGEQQIAEGLGFAPALTVTVHEDGEFSIYGPPSHSALYKHMAKRGWAEPTRDAAGNRHETLDGGFWTRLPDVKFREVVGLLGDVHARVLDWRGVEHTGLYWKRTTGATGNIGGHEGAIYFSRPTAEFVQAAADRATDLFQTSKTFGLWHKTVGTQFHKASVDADFGRVFKIGQKFLQDVSQFAMDAADQAPALLPKLGSIRDVFKRGPKKADLEAVSKTIFNGTLDNKLYSDAELAALGLNEKQRALYREFRAATDKSIDDLFVAELTRELRAQFPMLGRRLVGMSAEDAHAVAIDMLQEELAGHQFVAREAAEGSKEKATAERMAADLKAQIKASVEKFNRVQKLKGEGYAPLMRFGQYTVDATTTDAGGAPERVAFFMFETEREANAAARKLRAADPTLTVTQGVMSQEEWRMFQGVSPDSMELFAEALGADQSEVFQKYLKLTLNNRSALKRLIRRTGVEGFSQDATRVLATFITSNSRLAARTLNVMPMKEAVDAIPREKGDVKDEAVKLANYLTDPKEEAQALRGWMFVHFIGGSVASALTNMTQPLTMTAPYLAQWGSAKAGKALAAAAKVIARKSTGDVRLDSALAKAEAEGITAPHEIHQLYAESIRSLGSNAIVRKGLTAWGQAFALAEAFNRRLTFIAAFKMAQENPALGNAFAFAERAVEETQGIYNKGNRPDWARGAVGATVFTFKQFSIAYVEFLKRLPPKQRALALAILFLAAGLQGWPFAEDVQDLIDTIGQSFGYNINSKRWTHEFAVRTLGEGMGEFVTHGFSAIPGVPLDVSARMGLGNLIPGTAMFKLSETDRSRDVLEFVGPAGAIVKSGMDAFSAVQQGRIGAAAAMAMPVAAQNFSKALDMVQTGEYRDRQGRKVTEVDGYDAAIKAIGFQPAKVAKDSRAVFETKQSIDMARNVESSLADRWARGIIEQDPAAVREARADLADWNAKNPESRIVITPRQIAQRVKEARMSRAQRFVKTAPRELRPMAMESLTGG